MAADVAGAASAAAAAAVLLPHPVAADSSQSTTPRVVVTAKQLPRNLHYLLLTIASVHSVAEISLPPKPRLSSSGLHEFVAEYSFVK